MIEYFISISEAPSKIAQLPEQFAEDSSAVIVTSEGEPVMAILPYSEYKFLEKIDSLLETMEIMQDEELMAAFRQSVQELAEGKTKSWVEVKKELGLP